MDPSNNNKARDGAHAASRQQRLQLLQQKQQRQHTNQRDRGDNNDFRSRQQPGDDDDESHSESESESEHVDDHGGSIGDDQERHKNVYCGGGDDELTIEQQSRDGRSFKSDIEDERRAESSRSDATASLYSGRTEPSAAATTTAGNAPVALTGMQIISCSSTNLRNVINRNRKLRQLRQWRSRRSMDYNDFRSQAGLGGDVDFEEEGGGGGGNVDFETEGGGTDNDEQLLQKEAGLGGDVVFEEECGGGGGNVDFEEGSGGGGENDVSEHVDEHGGSNGNDQEPHNNVNCGGGDDGLTIGQQSLEDVRGDTDRAKKGDGGIAGAANVQDDLPSDLLPPGGGDGYNRRSFSGDIEDERRGRTEPPAAAAAKTAGKIPALLSFPGTRNIINQYPQQNRVRELQQQRLFQSSLPMRAAVARDAGATGGQNSVVRHGDRRGRQQHRSTENVLPNEEHGNGRIGVNRKKNGVGIESESASASSAAANTCQQGQRRGIGNRASTAASGITRAANSPSANVRAANVPAANAAAAAAAVSSPVRSGGASNASAPASPVMLKQQQDCLSEERVARKEKENRERSIIDVGDGDSGELGELDDTAESLAQAAAAAAKKHKKPSPKKETVSAVSDATETPPASSVAAEALPAPSDADEEPPAPSDAEEEPPAPSDAEEGMPAPSNVAEGPMPKAKKKKQKQAQGELAKKVSSREIAVETYTEPVGENVIARRQTPVAKKYKSIQASDEDKDSTAAERGPGENKQKRVVEANETPMANSASRKIAPEEAQVAQLNAVALVAPADRAALDPTAASGSEVAYANDAGMSATPGQLRTSTPASVPAPMRASVPMPAPRPTASSVPRADETEPSGVMVQPAPTVNDTKLAPGADEGEKGLNKPPKEDPSYLIGKKFEIRWYTPNNDNLPKLVELEGKVDSFSNKVNQKGKEYIEYKINFSSVSLRGAQKLVKTTGRTIPKTFIFDEPDTWGGCIAADSTLTAPEHITPTILHVPEPKDISIYSLMDQGSQRPNCTVWMMDGPELSLQTVDSGIQEAGRGVFLTCYRKPLKLPKGHYIYLTCYGPLRKEDSMLEAVFDIKDSLYNHAPSIYGFELGEDGCTVCDLTDDRGKLHDLAKRSVAPYFNEGKRDKVYITPIGMPDKSVHVFLGTNGRIREGWKGEVFMKYGESYEGCRLLCGYSKVNKRKKMELREGLDLQAKNRVESFFTFSQEGPSREVIKEVFEFLCNQAEFEGRQGLRDNKLFFVFSVSMLARCCLSHDELFDVMDAMRLVRKVGSMLEETELVDAVQLNEAKPIWDQLFEGADLDAEGILSRTIDMADQSLRQILAAYSD